MSGSTRTPGHRIRRFWRDIFAARMSAAQRSHLRTDGATANRCAKKDGGSAITFARLVRSKACNSLYARASISEFWRYRRLRLIGMLGAVVTPNRLIEPGK